MVIVAEIVVFGSQFMSEFDQIFYHILIELIFTFLFVLIQDNPKLLETRFV